MGKKISVVEETEQTKELKAELNKNRESRKDFAPTIFPKLTELLIDKPAFFTETGEVKLVRQVEPSSATSFTVCFEDSKYDLNTALVNNVFYFDDDVLAELSEIMKDVSKLAKMCDEAAALEIRVRESQFVK